MTAAGKSALFLSGRTLYDLLPAGYISPCLYLPLLIFPPPLEKIWIYAIMFI